MILLLLRHASAVTLGLVLSTHPAGAAEPLSAWLDAMGSAAQALQSGDARSAREAALCAEAALPAGEAGARAILARGLAAARAGRDAEAVASLRRAQALLPLPLRPYALRHLSSALSRSGHPGLAAAASAEAGLLAAPGPDRARLALSESRALLAAGLPGPAARTVEPAADVPALLAFANALLALHDGRAGPAYRTLFVEHAGEPEGEEAARVLAEGLAGPPPSTEERLARVEHLLASARAGKAWVELERLRAEGAEPVPPRALLLRGVALLQLGRPAEAEAAARELAARADAGPDAGAVEWVLAQAAARLGRLEEAAGRYRRVATLRPTVAGLPAAQQADLADDAAFLAAWLWYDAGRFEKAAPLLADFARRHPHARREPDARWFEAWAIARLGRAAAGRRAMAILARTATGQLRAAALYWGGRLASSSDQAVSLYAAAARETPDGWYAVLATARLAEMGRAAPQPAPLPAGAPVEKPADPRLAAAQAHAGDLLGDGQRHDGLALLGRLSSSGAARAAAAPLAEMAAFAGDAEIPFRMARDYLPPTRRSDRWYYPEALPGSVFPAAAGLGVDPLLALAVMRRESSFRARVRSAGAAEGLMQLRPETAERLAGIFGLEPPGPDDLADPTANLWLGIAYLGLLGSRFALVPPVLAAYNAGPARALAWSSALSGRPLDEWVEDIPYRETRQYVRSVVGDWAHYRRLRGERSPPLDPSALVLPPGPGISF